MGAPAPAPDAIYLDHNATTPVLAEVLEAMLPYLTSQFGNPSSEHALGRSAAQAVHAAREQVAAALSCHPDEVVFTSGGTESNNLAIRGAAAASSRRRVVSSTVEHPATERPLEHLRARGWTVTHVPVTPQGHVTADDVAAALGPDVALVTLMLAQNETGALMPVAQAAEAAHGVGALAHTDAAQAVGKVAITVDGLGVDLLSVAGHKCYAPKGVGALYVRRGTPLHPVLLGAGQEHGRRPGTENVAAVVGLGVALAMAQGRLPEEAVRLAGLRDELWAVLSTTVPGLVRFTPEQALPNTLTVGFPGVSGRDLLAATPEVAASTGSACHSGEETPSAVLLAMGVDPAVARGAVRLSLGHGTTVADVARAGRALVGAYRRAAVGRITA